MADKPVEARARLAVEGKSGNVENEPRIVKPLSAAACSSRVMRWSQTKSMNKLGDPAISTANKPVIFYFHGSQRALHAILHRCPRTDQFHVRSFNEQGTATTPFQIVVLLEPPSSGDSLSAKPRERTLDALRYRDRLLK
jgi:XFP-like protein